jgi:cell wall-associated NlpC family hydrolase
MQKAICLLAVIPMRKEASHRSEMVSQVLFGEYVEMKEEKEDFVLVRCDYDGYEGWVQKKQLMPVKENDWLTTNNYTTAFVTTIAVNNGLLQIPYSSPVYNGNELSFTIGKNKIEYLTKPIEVRSIGPLQLNAQMLVAVYQPFLNVPYLWGGKSVFGTDCSGFAQQVFKMFGIKLLRDAYLQAEQGEAVNSLEEAKLGDLAFFQNEKGRITHVGIILDDKKIIHASGKVRIDGIDKEGIWDERGERTHVMHSVIRIK